MENKQVSPNEMSDVELKATIFDLSDQINVANENIKVLRNILSTRIQKLAEKEPKAK